MSHEIPIANIYYLLCYAWNALDEKDEDGEVGILDSPDLLNLFARVLTNGMRRLLHRGLDRGYLSREGELPGVRGKLLVSQTLRCDLLRQGRAACDWDELEYDTLPNRILKATLVRLVSADLEEKAKAAVRDALRWLTPISTMKLRGTLPACPTPPKQPHLRLPAQRLRVCSRALASGISRRTEPLPRLFPRGIAGAL